MVCALFLFLTKGKEIFSCLRIKVCTGKNFSKRAFFSLWMYWNFMATHDINHWLIAFRESKNKLSMWNNNIAEVYKALILLADKMICWYRASNCFPYDTCHYFPPLLVPGHLQSYGESVLKKGWMTFLLKAIQRTCSWEYERVCTMLWLSLIFL